MSDLSAAVADALVSEPRFPTFVCTIVHCSAGASAVLDSVDIVFAGGIQFAASLSLRSVSCSVVGVRSKRVSTGH